MAAQDCRERLQEGEGALQAPPGIGAVAWGSGIDQPTPPLCFANPPAHPPAHPPTHPPTAVQ